jgi:hypothetical protein
MKKQKLKKQHPRDPENKDKRESIKFSLERYKSRIETHLSNLFLIQPHISQCGIGFNITVIHHLLP